MPGVLSQRDSLILGTLFDAEAAPKQQPVRIQAASLPCIPADVFAALRTRESDILKCLSDRSPSPEAVENAIQSISTIIDEHGTYASAYVNRAQAKRLLVPTDLLFTKDRAKETSLLMVDLDTAIEVTTPKSRSQQASSYEQDVLATAHTHRGFLLMRAADLVRDSVPLFGVSDDLRTKDVDEIDEMVFQEFELGGSYGNEDAAKMAVRTNPYAKLCGAIVSEAMRKEMEEYWRMVDK